MNDSKGSVVVGGECASDGQAEVVVVPDRGGEREDALGDSGANTADGAAAVSFEVELALEGPVDRLDHLAQGFEEFGAGPGFLSFAGGAEQFDSRCCQAGFEVFAEVVLVTDQDLPAARWCSDGWASGENVFEDGALVGLGSGQCPAHWEPVQGADQMQT